MVCHFSHIVVEREGDIAFVRLHRRRLAEEDVLEFAEEMIRLVVDEGYRKVVLCLERKDLTCLYSVYLAKLVTIRRRLLECGGVFVICEASPEVLGVLDACHLRSHFPCVPDRAAALTLLQRRDAAE